MVMVKLFFPVIEDATECSSNVKWVLTLWLFYYRKTYALICN
jgi:hypothetical protein